MTKILLQSYSVLNLLQALLLAPFISYHSVAKAEYENDLYSHQVSFQSDSKDHHEPASLPVENSTRSFWLHPSSEVNPLAKIGSTGPLTNDADVCIIGSGITGVSTAYHLSRLMERHEGLDHSPLRVALFEARDFCLHRIACKISSILIFV